MSDSQDASVSFWTQRTTVVVAVACCLLVIGAAAELVLVSWVHGWYFDLLRFLAHGLIVAGVTLLISELKPTREYIEERLSNVLHRFSSLLLDRTTLELVKSKEEFTKLASDWSYLRGTYNVDTLNRIHISVNQALAGRPLDANQVALVNTMDSSLQRILSEPYRQDYKLFLEHELEKCNGNADCIRVRRSLEWTLINPFPDAAKPFTQKFRCDLVKIPGLDKEKLFIPGDLYIDDKLTPLKFDVIEDVPNLIAFYAECSIPAKERVQIRMFKDVRRIPTNDYFRHTIFYSSKGFYLRYRHPAAFLPKLHIFGMEPAPSPRRPDDNTYEWEYSAWLLPGHGLMLTWT